MRVLFLTLYPETVASPRYRVMQYLPYLREAGIECEVACALTPRQHARFTGPNRKGRAAWYHLIETPRRLLQLLTAGRHDVLFVQKAIMTAYVRGFAGLLRRLRIPIVFDFDDAVHLAPPHPLRNVWKGLEDRKQIFKILESASLVLAGNAWLASVAEAAGARTAVFPTVIDTTGVVPAAHPPEVYRIGWIGSPSTTSCLEPAAQALAAAENVEVCVVGADPAKVPIPKACVREWTLEHEVAELQRFSVGIMPLPKTEWMRGKCALKALQYMACGIPCIATPFGAALDVIQDGVNGLFADSTDEWLDAVNRLREPSLRNQLGKAARATVEERYSLKGAAPEMRRLLESLQ